MDEVLDKKLPDKQDTSEQEADTKQEGRMLIRISVRNLVEFILRTGDLDNRQGERAQKDAMIKGSRIHKKIQKRMGSCYEAEVVLKHRIEKEDYSILIEGRADGIIREQKTEGEEMQVVIDEIKCVSRNLLSIGEPEPLHLAQAKCYAYFYALQNKLSEIGIRMTYCDLETEQLQYFHSSYEFRTLQEWFGELIHDYEKWAQFMADWRRTVQASVLKLCFPFPYREGQKQLVSGVYRTIMQNRRLFIQASTGVGKTISTVYPSVQAIGKGWADKIFYLTAKTITRTVAQETFGILMKQGLSFKVIVLTAKEKMCVCDEVNCNPAACERAQGHFDYVNDAVFDMIEHEDVWDRDVILDYAARYDVCPFEMSLDASLWADAIICDYNYVFDYDVCLKRFFGDTVHGNYIFLIDEAHNLVERAREMYSASLVKEDFLEVKKLVKPYSRKLTRLLEGCNSILLEWKKECDDYRLMDFSEINVLTVKLVSLMSAIEDFLEDNEDAQTNQAVLELYFQVRHFMNMADTLDENYLIYCEYQERQFLIKLFCVNPSVHLEHFLCKGIAGIFFSATLLPIEYYMKLLTTDMDSYTMYAMSTFPPANRRILISSDVSSRYSRRGQTEYERIAEYLQLITSVQNGNYIVYFPSYLFMKDVYECFLAGNTKVTCLLQKTAMSELEKEEFLGAFSNENNDGTLLGFCVLGGIFSEGIDLRKDSLIGTIIVGTGLPQICTERELLKNYFDKEGNRGFEYAYRYPGLNKVLQAAGRVIRTDEDRGIIVLMDDRFLERAYQGLYPREWTDITICNKSAIEGELMEFWNRQE